VRVGQHPDVAFSGENLLQRLSANEEPSLRIVLALRPETADPEFNPGLTPRVRMLVRLAALVALDASTTCLRWAVELASCAGADDDDPDVRVLRQLEDGLVLPGGRPDPHPS